MSAIISVQGLGKKYSLRHLRDQRYIALRDVLVEKATGLFRRNSDKASRVNDAKNLTSDRGPLSSGSAPAAREDFWALRNVSFDVKQSEVVGIIGRNGAGKSTLLKILSRITEPTEGKIHIKGRVASLLEVGTGFHPELTGRENIFLNGAILGMNRAEIRTKFDEIVAFAEIEKFLDTPVKRYSSGMYVRLAFAVAAHLEPEILIVDEVLAVGDAEFQKKCLGKMKDVSKGGRTVLFVSHNLAAIQSLCSGALYIRDGRLAGIGGVTKIVAQYLAQSDHGAAGHLSDRVPLGRALVIETFQVAPNPVHQGEPLTFNFEFRAEQDTRITELVLLIYTSQGIRVAIIDLRSRGLPVSLSAGRVWGGRATISAVCFVEGDYNIGLYAVTGSFGGDILNLIRITVLPATNIHGPAPYPAAHRGVVELQFSAELAAPKD